MSNSTSDRVLNKDSNEKFEKQIRTVRRLVSTFSIPKHSTVDNFKGSSHKSYFKQKLHLASCFEAKLKSVRVVGNQ